MSSTAGSSLTFSFASYIDGGKERKNICIYCYLKCKPIDGAVTFILDNGTSTR